MKRDPSGQEMARASDAFVNLPAALDHHDVDDPRLLDRLVDNPPRTHARFPQITRATQRRREPRFGQILRQLLQPGE